MFSEPKKKTKIVTRYVLVDVLGTPQMEPFIILNAAKFMRDEFYPELSIMEIEEEIEVD